MADAQTEAKKILDNADKNAALEEQKRIQQAQEQIAGLVVEATAKLVAAKQNADSDRELYNLSLIHIYTKNILYFLN